MNSPNNIQDELNSLNSSLPAGLNKTPYAVPEGYFEGLAASVMAKIKGNEDVSAAEEIAQLSPLLVGISRALPYNVPDNYFTDNIESLSAFTSENEESLVLSFIEKEMPYDVPTGYFANFSEQILEKVAGQKAKVVPMRRRWINMAAAAIVTGIITISGINYFNSKGSDVITKDPVAVELKKASTEELNAFIKSTDVNVTDNTTAQNTPEAKHLFNDVSDKELAAFLDQVPTDDEEFDLN